MLKRMAAGVAAIAVLGVGGFAYLGFSSKSGSARGIEGGALAPCPDTPNCVSSEDGTAQDKVVEPLPLESWDRLAVAIEGMGGKVTSHTDDYIAAEFTSPTFGFVDDLELRKGEARIEVRSASRVGYSDGGVNAERVERLRAAL